MVTITDVAKKAGVSISTVSNVINGTKFVGDELREKVNLAINELGYQANEMAASMKRRTTKNIGVILPNIGMVFFPDVLKGIEAAARDNGYKLFYFSTDYNFEKEKEYINLLRSSWVDGIILDSCCPIDKIYEYQEFLVGELHGKHFPVVTLEAPFSHPKLGVITLNEVDFTQNAIEHLIGLGHRDIALLLGPEKIPMYTNNVKGIKIAFEKHGIIFDHDEIMCGDYFAESGYNAINSALKRGKKFSALFSANDQMAIGAIKAINEHGLKVPDDIAVMGVDGIYVTTLIQPSLTTVELPRYDLGYTSCSLLVEMLRSKSPVGKKIVLNGKLTVRRSTNPQYIDSWDLTGW